MTAPDPPKHMVIFFLHNHVTDQNCISKVNLKSKTPQNLEEQYLPETVFFSVERVVSTAPKTAKQLLENQPASGKKFEI